MHLLDLPAELFTKLLEQTVLTVGLTEAIKLRLVCKTFDEEIPIAMCNARILDTEQRRTWFVPHNSWLVVEYIFRKTWANNYGTANLPAAIRLAAQTLATDTTEASQEACIRKLSKAAACKMVTRSILHYVKSGTEKDKVYCRHLSTTNHIVAAAAYLGDLRFFKSLCKEGDIDSSENIYFGNPLRCAVDQGHYDLTKLMLDHGVDVNQAERRTGYGGTALQTAAFTGQMNFINLMLDPKYKCHTSGDDYDDAILKAGAAGHLAIVQLLITHVNVEPTQVLRNCLLLHAAETGHEEVLRFALKIGANPNTEEKCNGYAIPISVAARHGYDKVMKILLEHGAIPKMGGRQDTPTIPIKRGYKKAVQVLLDYGVDFNDPMNSPVTRAYAKTLDDTAE